MVDYLPGYIHGRLSEQFSESRAAFGTTFRVTGGFRTAEKPPEEDYWMDFKISKWFKKHAETLFWIFFTKRQPKIVKTVSAHWKVLLWLLGPLKEYCFKNCSFSSWVLVR
jgi:hypothetical protein